MGIAICYKMLQTHEIPSQPLPQLKTRSFLRVCHKQTMTCHRWHGTLTDRQGMKEEQVVRIIVFWLGFPSWLYSRVAILCVTRIIAPCEIQYEVSPVWTMWKGFPNWNNRTDVTLRWNNGMSKPPHSCLASWSSCSTYGHNYKYTSYNRKAKIFYLAFSGQNHLDSTEYFNYLPSGSEIWCWYPFIQLLFVDPIFCAGMC